MAVIDHLGIAVRRLEAAAQIYQALGLALAGVEEIAHEGVRVAMLPAGPSRIELLEPTRPDSPVGRFLAKRGEGLHHVALLVPDLAVAVERLRTEGVRLVKDEIQIGAGGQRYVFLQPSATAGVLIELVEKAR